MSTTNVIDPIHGSIDLSEIERLIVDTPPFQRLRKIKQLGNVHLVFPGATHTRFAHSLGVMHLAGRMFDALVKSYPDVAQDKVAIKIRQRVRLAALLHDIGHGPFSHQFEQFLKAKKFVYGDLSAELQIPELWRKEERKLESPLSHEDFSFGITKYIFEKLDIQKNHGISSQDICSLLDDKISTTENFDEDLKRMSALIHETADFNGLKKCLKSILSSEIDADRLDYLQRDSLFCGSKITAIDADHILNSIALDVDLKKSIFIALKANAVSAVEQVLISRKVMFDQVYTHHVNAAFDEMLINLMSEHLKCRKPITFKWYLNLTDEMVEGKIRESITTLSSNDILDKEAKFFATRTTLKKVTTKFCQKFEVSKFQHELEKIFEVVENKRVIRPFSLKDFTKLDRDKNTGKDSLLKIKGDYDNIEPIPINLFSEVFKSSLWRTDTVKLIVFEGIDTSAVERQLKVKLTLMNLPEENQTSEKASTEVKVKPA